MSDRRPQRRWRRSASVLLFALLLCGSAQAVLAAECTAKLNARLDQLEREDYGTNYAFEVELRSREYCARVNFALVVEERLPDGTWQTRRIAQFARIRGGRIERRVIYKLPDDRRLGRWSFELDRCVTCDERGTN